MAETKDITGWQPIETAPKDGTWVLLYEPSSANGVRPGVVLQASWVPHRAYSGGGFWRSPLARIATVLPLCWMPLEFPRQSE